MDFVADRLADGRRFRALTVVDIYTRESLAVEAEQSWKGEDVVTVLNRILLQRGTPEVLFCDNGSEFASQAMDLWAYRNGVRIFSRPGKPTDNAFVESFNGLAIRMPRCSLVHDDGRGQTTHRGMATRMQ